MAHRNQLIYLWFLLVIFHVFLYVLFTRGYGFRTGHLKRQVYDAFCLLSTQAGCLGHGSNRTGTATKLVQLLYLVSLLTNYEIWLYKTCCCSYLRRIRWSLGLLSPELNTYLWVNTCNKVVSWDTSMCQDIRNQHKCEHRTKQHRYRLKNSRRNDQHPPTIYIYMVYIYIYTYLMYIYIYCIM